METPLAGLEEQSPEVLAVVHILAEQTLEVLHQAEVPWEEPAQPMAKRLVVGERLSLLDVLLQLPADRPEELPEVPSAAVASEAETSGLRQVELRILREDPSVLEEVLGAVETAAAGGREVPVAAEADILEASLLLGGPEDLEEQPVDLVDRIRLAEQGRHP